MKDHVQSMAHSENDTSLFFKQLTCRWLPNCHECVISELVYGFYVGYKRRVGISPYSMSGTNFHFTESWVGTLLLNYHLLVPTMCQGHVK